MTALRDVQHVIRQALLAGDGAELTPLIHGDGLDAATRLAFYRATMVSSLTDVLKDVFPTVCRLVGGPFFAQVAEAFVRAEPPRHADLNAYGDAFPAFLAAHAPARDLVYLADVARLDWLTHRSAVAPDSAGLEAAALEGIPAEATPRLRFRLAPGLGLIASPWPIERIWRANRPDGDAEEAIDLDGGGVRLEVRRRGDLVTFRELTAADYALRAALAAHRTLEQAAEAALAEDGAFDLAGALADLFQTGAIVALDPG